MQLQHFNNSAWNDYFVDYTALHIRSNAYVALLLYQWTRAVADNLRAFNKFISHVAEIETKRYLNTYLMKPVLCRLMHSQPKHERIVKFCFNAIQAQAQNSKWNLSQVSYLKGSTDTVENKLSSRLPGCQRFHTKHFSLTGPLYSQRFFSQSSFARSFDRSFFNLLNCVVMDEIKTKSVIKNLVESNPFEKVPLIDLERIFIRKEKFSLKAVASQNGFSSISAMIKSWSGFKVTGTGLSTNVEFCRTAATESSENGM